VVEEAAVGVGVPGGRGEEKDRIENLEKKERDVRKIDANLLASGRGFLTFPEKQTSCNSSPAYGPLE
jgi:hypothetical protein